MESARELGVEFESNKLYLCRLSSKLKIRHVQGMKEFEPFSGQELNDYTRSGDAGLLSFTPLLNGFPDHTECARLDALGVKRYEQGGGE